MVLQMLISSLQGEPEKLLKGMRPECGGVLVNQCDRDEEKELNINGNVFTVVSRNERGVGRSRNEAISRGSGDVLLFADEDIVYEPGYAANVLDAFRTNPKADIILFNVKVCEERRTYWNEGIKRIRWYNCGRFPAYSIAIRKSALEKCKVRYSELFGGGARYSNGEDSLFLKECASAGCKIYTSPVCIGEEIPRESTWFHGFTEKFFFDRGVLFFFLYGGLAPVWCLRFVLTKRSMLKGEIGAKKAYRLIMDGIREGKQVRKGLKK